MSTERERVEIRLVYVGRRHGSRGKATHAWREADDLEKLRAYDKAKGTVVGGIYLVEEYVDSPGTIDLNSLRFSGDKLDDPYRVASWEVEHQAIIRQEQRDKAERSMARRTELDRLCEPLEDLARTLRTRHDVAALQSLVNQRLVDAYYSKGK